MTGWTAALALVAIALVAIFLVAARDINRAGDALTAEGVLVDTRHGKLEYVAWGDGPTVLVIHGAGGGFDQGRLLAIALGGPGFRWIAVSRFGYLGTPLPADASVTAQAEALVDLLDSLSIDTAAVLAISGGAPPALKLAELAPGRVSRMVLISPAPFTPFGGDIETRQAPAAFYTALFGSDFVYWALLKTARPLLEEAFDARPALKRDLPPSERAFLTDIVDAFMPASRRIEGVRNEGAAVDPAQRYDLEAIKAPTLIISAKDDHMNPHAVSVTLADRIERADLLDPDSGGHLLLGRHAETQAATRAFLTARD